MGHFLKIFLKMASKSAQLLKHMATVNVNIFPFKGHIASARQFYAMSRSLNAMRANENCISNINILNKYEPANIKIEWSDKSTLVLETETMGIDDILAKIEKTRKKITLKTAIQDIADEYQPEPDPFQEAIEENKKRLAEKKRKGGSQKR